MDAFKISASYQNLWKRINKKSVFNFEQMKKSIKKIVEIYCTVKNHKSHKIKKNKEKIEVKENKIKKISNISSSKSELRKSKSLKHYKIFYEKLFQNLEEGEKPLKIINNIDLKKCKSMKNLKIKININNYNIKKELRSINSKSSVISSFFCDSSNSSSLSFNQCNNNKRSKIINVSNISKNLNYDRNSNSIFEGNDKAYKNIKQNNNEYSNSEIIDEEQKHQCSIHSFQLTNSLIKSPLQIKMEF